MTSAASMTVRVVLPTSVLLERAAVTRILAEHLGGSFCILPHRLDGVAALVPGIMSFETASGDEAHVAVDEGILVKLGFEVTVAVRRAVTARDLPSLQQAVRSEFLRVDERERATRMAMSRLQASFLRRFAELGHG